MVSDIIVNAIRVDIFEMTNDQGFICVFKSNGGQKHVLEYTISHEKEALLVRKSSFTDKIKNANCNVSFDLNSSIGLYLYRKYIQDPAYRQIPDAVKALINYISELRLPVVIGPNVDFTLGGCEDASKVRKRIIDSQEYMPIFDELKSLIFLVGRKKKYYVLTHCRGNREIDRNKLRKFLQKTIKLNSKQTKSIGMIQKEILRETFSLEKGRVTPFLPYNEMNGAQIIHVFDSDCLKSYGMPMMTNANDPEWATEFDGPDLVKHFCKRSPERYFVDQIVRHPPSEALSLLTNYHNKFLGVIEYGLPSATLFRSKLNEYSRNHIKQLYEVTGEGGEKIPLVYAGTFSEFSQYSILSPELEKIMEPDLYSSSVKDKLSEIIKTLKNAKCNIIAIPCNILPHYVDSTANILSITQAVQESIKVHKGRGLFLGGRSVRDSERSIYKDRFTKGDNERLFYLSLSESKNIDEAMMAVNIERFEITNKKIFEVLIPYLGKIDFIVVASTSLSVYLDKQSVLLNHKYFASSGELEKVCKINELPIVDTLIAYAKFCAKKLFK